MCEIRIQYSYLLDPYFKMLLEFKQQASLVDKNVLYKSPEQIEEKIIEFKKAWEEVSVVLPFMQKTLSLEFYKDILDVYIVGNMKGAISSPIVISSTTSIKDFKSILIHEILHNLIADNKQKIPVVKILLEIFPHEEILVRNHVMIFAMMYEIYTNFFKTPELLKDIKGHDRNASAYLKAWEIVENLGYKQVLEKFKSMY